jgi:predicted enzyme related to lactoylglutathione lyase
MEIRSEGMMQPADFTRRAAVGLAVGAAATAQANALGLGPKEEKAMERVLGVGGFFFRAKDPKALAKWYEDNLGIPPVPTKYGMPSWETDAGTTVFAPFAKDTSYFGDPAQQWMINFRVRDLDKMAAQLRAGGIAVEVDPQRYPNGRFAQLKDIEGNPIQLWQPQDKSPG